MKKIFTILFILVQIEAIGQAKKVEHGVQFGILKRANSLKITPTEAINGVANKDAWGLNFGYSLYYLPNPNIAFRFSPGIGFEQENLAFSGKYRIEDIRLDYCYLKIPVHALISLHENSRYKVIAGFTKSVQISQQYNEIKEKLNFNENDFAIDFGLNYQIFTKLCSVTPEIRFSRPVINAAATSTPTDLGLVINEFYRQQFSITLYIRPYLTD